MRLELMTYALRKRSRDNSTDPPAMGCDDAKTAFALRVDVKLIAFGLSAGNVTLPVATYEGRGVA